MKQTPNEPTTTPQTAAAESAHHAATVGTATAPNTAHHAATAAAPNTAHHAAFTESPSAFSVSPESVPSSRDITANRATDLASFFGALCFFLSAIEFLIPKPLPFLRLGLANVPLIIAMRVLSFKHYALLVALKLIGQALIGGTLFSYIFLFSACGTVASALMMFALYKAFGRHISCTGISIAGALSSNAAQLLLARYFIFGEGALLIAPPFLLVGTITSALLGLFSEYFVAHSEWFRAVQNGSCLTLTSKAQKTVKKSPVKAAVYFALLALLLFSPHVALNAAIFALSIVLLAAAHKKLHLGACLIASAAIIALNLLTPAGRVLFEWRTFKITADALLNGVNKALVLEGMIYLSRLAMSNVTVLPLGFLGKVLARSLGVFALLTETAPKTLGVRTPRRLVALLDQTLLAFCAPPAPDEE